MTHRTRHAAAAVRVPAPGAGRARLDPAARLARRHPRAVGVGPVAAGQLRQERQAAPRRARRPGRRALLRRPGRPTSSAWPRCRCCCRRRCSTRWCRDATARHRGVLRRPDPPLHDAGRLRPRTRLAVAPVRHPRLAARARHVGRRGADPPLPDQGARRTALHLPAVLRPLHPDGPGRQLHPDGRQAQADPQAGRPVRRAHRLPAGPPGVRDVVVSGGDVANVPWTQPRVVPDAAARHRDHPRHPAGHQGAGRPAPALAAARRGRGAGAGRPHRRPPRGQPGHPHPRQPRPVADPAGGPGRPDRAGGRRARRAQPGRADARRQRHHRGPARPVLRAAGRGRHPAVLLLHVRHDPQRRALAGGGLAGPAAAARHHGLPARLRHPADRLRRAVRRQALGAHGHRVRPRARHLVLDEELPHLDRGRRRRGARRSATPTTTRSTRCPRPARSGGASRRPSNGRWHRSTRLSGRPRPGHPTPARRPDSGPCPRPWPDTWPGRPR